MAADHTMEQFDLKRNHVYIREDPTKDREPPPAHILNFQNAILDFDWSVADVLEGWSDAQVRAFDDLPPDEIGLPELERAWVSNTLKDYVDVVERAKQIFILQDWETFYRGFFLTPLAQQAAHIRYINTMGSNVYISSPAVLTGMS